ncbi:pyridoxamine 5'-phosphate oxidase family protein [Sulfitobacter sp.]|uniref:FAD-binding oxidoreductase n=1 Tax=Sulfitobacter sp. TaxID=1903071 RepID=UPI003299BDF7
MNWANPFHEGELQAQARAGVGNVAEWAGGFVRDYLPEQHRVFHSGLPFLVVSGADAAGQVWITAIDGAEGFVTSPDPRRLELATVVDPEDPLAEAFSQGTDIGVIGIELASRRRNRFSGVMHARDAGYVIDIRQSFGNCPQYIHERVWTRAPKGDAGAVLRSTALAPEQIALIGRSDTMFIGSGHQGQAGAASNGFDASHRGGAAGFVHVVDGTHLQIPDYAGNNFFNTIGNLLSDPRVGLLFVDFETGGLLHVSGRATIDWTPRGAQDPDAYRVIDVEIDAVLERPGAVGLRWRKQAHLSRRLKLARREQESKDITSFYFAPVDGRPLTPFRAGQHLPVELQIPGQVGTSKRSYSLSGAPDDRAHYRLSVKREAGGLVSGFFHDKLHIGGVIEAQAPSGDFVVPNNDCPLVLVSAGVGLTPMISALYANAQVPDRSVWYVHGARSGADYAMGKEVAQLVSDNPQLRKRIYFSQPEAGDVSGRDYDVAGRITVDDVLKINAGENAHYMLCGPAGFLADLRNGLEAAGVAESRIHFETFGPTG